MVDTYGGVRGGYANVTEVVSAAGQTQILAEVDKLRALLESTTRNANTADTVFGRMAPSTKTFLLAEIDALKAAIDAAPTA